VPIADRRDDTGATLRLDVRAAHDVIVLLGGYLSTDLRGWLEHSTEIAARLDECPLPSAVAADRLRLGGDADA